MTVQFSGVHFLYKPGADEKAFIRGCFPNDGEKEVEDKGDVFVVNTGTPGLNVVDEMLIDGLTSRGHNDAMTRTKEGDTLIVGFRTRGNSDRVIGRVLRGSADTQMKDMMKPVYYVAMGPRELSQAEIDQKAEQLGKDGSL